jgi:hypothetical protein
MVFHGCHYIDSKSVVKHGEEKEKSGLELNKYRSSGQTGSSRGATSINIDFKMVSFRLIQG